MQILIKNLKVPPKIHHILPYLLLNPKILSDFPILFLRFQLGYFYFLIVFGSASVVELVVQGKSTIYLSHLICVWDFLCVCAWKIAWSPFFLPQWPWFFLIFFQLLLKQIFKKILGKCDKQLQNSKENSFVPFDAWKSLSTFAWKDII